MAKDNNQNQVSITEKFERGIKEKKLVLGSKKYVDFALICTKEALTSNDANAYSRMKNNLDKAVKEFNVASQRTVYDKCAKAEKPFEELAKTFWYNGVKVTENKKDDGTLVGISLTKVQRRLSLRGFVNRAKVGTGIIAKIDCLRTKLIYHEFMTLRNESEKDFVAKFGAEAATNYYHKLKREKEAGRTPDSNRQIEKDIASIISDCGFEYRVGMPDRDFVMKAAFVHDASQKATLKPVPASKLQTVILDILAHVCDNAPYEVLTKTKDEKVISDAEDETETESGAEEKAATDKESAK